LRESKLFLRVYGCRSVTQLCGGGQIVDAAIVPRKHEIPVGTPA